MTISIIPMWSYIVWQEKEVPWTKHQAPSGPKKLLDQVARHGVKEEADHKEQENEEKNFQQEPTIRVPDKVADRLERVQEPDEAGIWAAGAGEQGRTRRRKRARKWGEGGERDRKRGMVSMEVGTLMATSNSWHISPPKIFSCCYW